MLPLRKHFLAHKEMDYIAVNRCLNYNAFKLASPNNVQGKGLPNIVERQRTAH